MCRIQIKQYWYLVAVNTFANNYLARGQGVVPLLSQIWNGLSTALHHQGVLDQ